MSDQATRRAAQIARQNANTAKSNAAAAKANADAAKAAADIERAKVDAIKAADEAADRAAKRSRASDPYERAYQIGINVAAPVAGIAVGHLTAKTIEKRHANFRTQANKEINSLARQAGKITAKPLPSGREGRLRADKLAGIVRTADRMNVLKSRGPLGLTRAALLVAEGAYVRFALAPKVENPVAREALSAVGSMSLFAATTQLGERVVQNATLRKLPAAASMATIETARSVATRAGAMAAKTAPVSGVRAAVRTGLSIAGKVALPIAVGMAAIEGVRGYMKGGTKGAAVGVADSLTFGAVSAVGRTVDAYRGQQRISGARATLARAASVRSAVTAKQSGGAITSRVRALGGRVSSNGQVASHTRIQAGRSVRVKGYRRRR